MENKKLAPINEPINPNKPRLAKFAEIPLTLLKNSGLNLEKNSSEKILRLLKASSALPRIFVLTNASRATRGIVHRRVK